MTLEEELFDDVVPLEVIRQFLTSFTLGLNSVLVDWKM